MWSRVRHRRLQALSLVALAALLTTSLCLGPLYQRAMEQALAGSVLANATPEQKAIRLSSDDRGAAELEDELPARLDPYLTAPIVSLAVPVSVPLPDGGGSVATRLYAVDAACTRLDVVAGSCPAESGQVMVSTADVATNGWTVGSQVPFQERLDAGLYPELSSGTVTVVGVYEPSSDEDWLGAPITGRAGAALQDVGLATDDWLTVSETMARATAAADWHRVTSSVVWSLDPRSVDHEAMARIGPIVEGVQRGELENPGGVRVLIATDIPSLSESVATGSEQGRTTVVVLVAQLLVLVAVVLWMVLVAATDDRRRSSPWPGFAGAVGAARRRTCSRSCCP